MTGRIQTTLLAVLLFAGSAFAQLNTLTQTSLSAATSATSQIITVASATNITATPATLLFVEGESMPVISITGTTVTVQRGANGTRASAHPNSAMVLAGAPSLFYTYPPSGGCTTATTLVTPYVDLRSGAEYLCSSVTTTWVAGFQNDLIPPAPTAAVASAAGLITPSGQLFHVTGTAAVTGFNIPVGFAFGTFTIIPDGVFTTTSANNIALASTAVVSKPLTFTFDPVTAKFYPSY